MPRWHQVERQRPGSSAVDITLYNLYDQINEIEVHNCNLLNMPLIYTCTNDKPPVALKSERQCNQAPAFQAKPNEYGYDAPRRHVKSRMHLSSSRRKCLITSKQQDPSHQQSGLTSYPAYLLEHGVWMTNRFKKATFLEHLAQAPW